MELPISATSLVHAVMRQPGALEPTSIRCTARAAIAEVLAVTVALASQHKGLGSPNFTRSADDPVAEALVRVRKAQLTDRTTTFTSTVPPTAYAAMPSLDRSG